jgi:nucleoside-diphosphate-sugar epimerase
MRIVLTGAAGFIGSHLADRLLLDAHDIVGVDDLSTGRYENVAHLQSNAAFTFVEADASEPLRIDGRVDWVLHFASPASPPHFLAAPVETLRVNGEGTRHLLELARDNGGAFMLESTSEVYGDPLEHQQTESYRGNVNAIGPRSPYDEGKRYAEAMATAFNRAHGVAIRICRIFNTYGPRMRADDGRVVTNLVAQALRGEPLTVYGDGSQTRSFQYIDDLVEGIVRLMAADVHEPVNLGNPDEHTVLEFAETVRRLTGSDSRIDFVALPPDDPKLRRPDISRARELLGWEPRVPLEDGLRRTIDALRAEIYADTATGLRA